MVNCLVWSYPIETDCWLFASSSFRDCRRISGGIGDGGVRVGGVGQYDLLIVGPGVLGRIVAERWQQVNYCFLYPFF